MADNNTVVDFDPNSFTLDELCDIEEATGFNTTAEFSKLDPQNPHLPMRLVQALIWIIRRRVNPEFTFKEAGQLRITDIDTSSLGGSGPVA